MSEQIQLIDWKPDCVRLQFSIGDDTPEVDEKDPAYPVNRGRLYSLVEQVERPFPPDAAWQRDADTVANAALQKLQEEANKKKQANDFVKSMATLPDPGNVIGLDVEHVESGGTFGYRATVHVKNSVTPVDLSDFEIRDCNDAYTVVHGSEPISEDGVAELREERRQDTTSIAGWYMELYDAPRSKVLRRWTMPPGDYGAVLL